MRAINRTLAAALGLIGLLAAGPAAAESPVSDELEITAAPYMWFLSLDGNATVKGQKGDVDVGFSDIWDNLNVGAMFEGEVRKGRFGVYGNIIYADLESRDLREKIASLEQELAAGRPKRGSRPKRSA